MEEKLIVRIDTPTWTPDTGASRAVALEVLLRGPISRTEIARRLDLSPGSLTRLSAPLIEAGLLEEIGEQTKGRAGRPSRPLDVVASSRHFIGLKLTGKSVLGVITDLKATVEHTSSRRLEDTHPDTVSDTIADLARDLTEKVDSITAIGLGIGGRISANGDVASAPFLGWEEVPLGVMVEERMGVPVVIDNDLVAFTEAEHWFGYGRGLNQFAVVTLGAGVGYGIVANRDLVVSDDFGIGLVGHWPMDPYGPVCPEGHRGCAKSMLEMDAVARNVSSAVGRHVTFDEALNLAEEGHLGARRVVNDAGRGLGRLLAAIGNLVMPEVIVLGGEGIRLAEASRDAVDKAISELRDPRAQPLRIEMTTGDNVEWCRGAAVLAIQRHVLGKRVR